MLKHWLIAITLIFTIMTSRSIGTVYGITGPLAGVYLYAEPSAVGGTGGAFAITDGSGYYSMTTGLTAGTYNLTALPPNGYVFSKIGPVTVVAGQTTAGVNIILQVSGGISGKVTDAISGNPINGTTVLASPSSGAGTSFGWFGTTGSDGSYLLATNLPTGTYNVSVFVPTGHIGNMTTASVVAGAETKNVNIQLARSGIISGKVSTPNGTGLFGISITAFTSGGTPHLGSATTDLSGNFRIVTGLGTGNYTVYAYGAGNTTAYGGFFTPIPVSVTAGQETSNIDIQLTPVTTPPTPSGTIRGRVTDTSSNPISFAQVTARGSGGTGYGETDNGGYYVISEGLTTGNDYNVSVTSSGYYDASYPTLVGVAAGQTTPNINVQMTAKPAQNFGTITGTVTGDTTVIPEFPYPLVEMLSLTLVTTLAATLSLKARRPTRKVYSQ